MGLRRYRVEPGEELSLGGLHYHDTQEEAFYVVEGTLHVETPERVYEVPADHCFVAEPGSPHRAHVDAEAGGPAVVIGVGAPPESDGHAYDG